MVAFRLFAPYWRTIAPMVIQDLHCRPQVVQHVSDLLSMTVPELLKETQAFTIPYLVLTKKGDILQKVADACRQSIRTICMEHINMASILTSILLCPSEDVEGMAVTLLRSASSEFDQINCAELVRTEPVLIASELLKVAGDADKYKESKVSTFTASTQCTVM